MLSSAVSSAQSRADLLTGFIAQSGKSHLERQPIRGDASFRRYERLAGEAERYIVMDAPPPQEDVRPFVAVTRLLRQMNFSAPEILAEDAANGFLLLEDMGNDSFSGLLKAQPAHEEELYLEATRLLVELGQKSAGQPSGLAPYDRAALLREIALLSDWFMPQAVGMEEARRIKPSYLAAWEQVLDAVPVRLSVPTLRDYHADNLMWLAGRAGTSRVGLLDYQDALQGDPAYDLVSFLEDIRRDVAPAVIKACLDAFIRESGEERDDFMRRYAVLGAQRNSKIVGIFTRLCVRDGKEHYLAMLPRVWAWLERDVEHPVLAPVKAWLDAHVPAARRGAIQANPALGPLA